MNIDQNIESLSSRLSEIETESTRIKGALDVLNTLKGMGITVVHPETSLETVAEDEVSDDRPSTSNENTSD